MPAQADAAPLREGAPEQPTPVKIGIKLQQITNVDQRAENYSVGATLMMRWHDPALAYSPDSDPCRCRFKTLKESNFDQLIMEKGRKWPEFTIYNQQGNRFSQNRLFGIFPDGDVLYFERFTTTLQAPDFNFRRYPFDRQQFFIHVDSVYPKDFYVFTDLEGFSEVGARLGQEEWKVQRFDTLVGSVTASTRGATSRFSFRVVANAIERITSSAFFSPSASFWLWHGSRFSSEITADGSISPTACCSCSWRLTSRSRMICHGWGT